METKAAGTSTAAPKPTPAPANPVPPATPAAPVEQVDPVATAEAESRTGPRSPTVKFAADFDYTWPSRAMTSYKKGWQGRVKAEVAVAADAAGVLESLDDGDNSK